jgi:hypothetical protein
MNLKGRRRYDMLGRVHAFGKRRSGAFPPLTLGGKMFGEIRDLVLALSSQAATRQSCERSLRSRASDAIAARRKLRESLQASHRTARGLAIDAPGVDRKYRLPRSRGDHALFAAARASAQHARKSAAAFVAHGLPVVFLDELAADVGRFERAIANAAAAKTAQALARAQLKDTLRRALVAVRRLDAIVPNVLRADPVALTSWGNARRVGRGPRRRQTRVKTRRIAVVRHLDAA